MKFLLRKAKMGLKGLAAFLVLEPCHEKFKAISSASIDFKLFFINFVGSESRSLRKEDF